MGLQALIYIIFTLRSKTIDNKMKLKVIHFRTVILCYIFLFIVSSLIRLCFILHPPFWKISISFLSAYILLHIARYSTSLDRFNKLVMKWIDDDRLTLYDIYNIYKIF